MLIPHSPNQNHLLAALPTAEFERLAPNLELVPMLLGETLYEPGGQLSHAYFPTTAIVSLLYVMESGMSAEIAGVGNEGVLGISLFMGGDTTPSSAVVQTAGHGYRLTRQVAEGGIQSRRTDAALVAALYSGAGHADVPDRRLQPAPFDRAATVPVAVADPRSFAFERVDHDAGIGCQCARRAPRRHYGGRRKPAARRRYSLPPRPHYSA